jgi:hypothetical protein
MYGCKNILFQLINLFIAINSRWGTNDSVFGLFYIGILNIQYLTTFLTWKLGLASKFEKNSISFVAEFWSQIHQHFARGFYVQSLARGFFVRKFCVQFFWAYILGLHFFWRKSCS